MTNELHGVLEEAGKGPLPETGLRVLEVLRRRRGADQEDVERLRRWSGHLARRLRGEATPAPADPLQRPTILYLDGFDDRAWHDPERYPVISILEGAASMIRFRCCSARSSCDMSFWRSWIFVTIPIRSP